MYWLHWNDSVAKIYILIKILLTKRSLVLWYYLGCPFLTRLCSTEFIVILFTLFATYLVWDGDRIWVLVYSILVRNFRENNFSWVISHFSHCPWSFSPWDIISAEKSTCATWWSSNIAERKQAVQSSQQHQHGYGQTLGGGGERTDWAVFTRGSVITPALYQSPSSP
jgi:hypothetical protein